MLTLWESFVDAFINFSEKKGLSRGEIETGFRYLCSARFKENCDGLEKRFQNIGLDESRINFGEYPTRYR